MQDPELCLEENSWEIRELFSLGMFCLERGTSWISISIKMRPRVGKVLFQIPTTFFIDFEF